MLHLQTILPDTLEFLKCLSAQPEMQGMRLVGGTALALQYGHRQSVDLDFLVHLPPIRKSCWRWSKRWVPTDYATALRTFFS